MNSSSGLPQVSVQGIREYTTGHGSGQADLIIWLLFQIVADHVALPILVMTFLLAKSVKRHPTLVNMCITWILAGIFSVLLLYAGKQQGPEPSHALCILQTSLLYATPPMTAVSALALVFQVWTSFELCSRLRRHRSTVGLYTLLIAPYVTLATAAISTAVISAQHVDRVNRARRFFYCSLDYSPLTTTLGAFTAIVCLITIGLEIHIAIILSRNWIGFRRTGRSGGLEFQIIIRILLFSAYLFIALIFTSLSIAGTKSVLPDMFAASVGMAVFLVFGTQPDVLRTWAFWLPRREQEKTVYIPREIDSFPATSLDIDGKEFDFGRDSVLVIGRPEEAFITTTIKP